ncbi:hypothetical protein GGR52DRAFT_137063 [Hypoxylon sp. FL1284]|nr:hypothetical protein GGR52DRAFT_137063 [Hypoxylon sp. FL1284]
MSYFNGRNTNRHRQLPLRPASTNSPHRRPTMVRLRGFDGASDTQAPQPPTDAASGQPAGQKPSANQRLPQNADVGAQGYGSVGTQNSSVHTQAPPAHTPPPQAQPTYASEVQASPTHTSAQAPPAYAPSDSQPVHAPADPPPPYDPSDPPPSYRPAPT